MKINKDNFGCLFNDRIDIEISPDICDDIINIFIKRCEGNSYNDQRHDREIIEMFSNKLHEWETLRREQDERNKNEGK